LDAVTPASHDGNVVGLQPNAPPVGTPASTGAVATDHVNVLVQVLVCPHAVAVKVNICWRPQAPTFVTEPAEQLTVTAPQLFEAVTAPPKLAIVAQVGSAEGLQPSSLVCPQLANTGADACTLTVLQQVTVPSVQVIVTHIS
jgi:hypothetical protein